MSSWWSRPLRGLRRWVSGPAAPEPPGPSSKGGPDGGVPPELLRKVRQIEIRTRRLVAETLAG